ncbi:MAG: PGPGW domain-containing protein [Nanoarchaeota archaeon]
MHPLSVYARSRIFHINLNAIISGIVSLIISAQIVYTTNYFIRAQWAVVLFSYVVDGLIDFLVFAGLHVVLYHVRSGAWSFSPHLAKDLMKLQSQRWVLTAVGFIASAGLHYLLMNLGFGRTRGFIIAYAISLLIMRTLHTFYGLRNGVFEPVKTDVPVGWKKLSPREKTAGMIMYLGCIVLIFVGIALLVLPGPGWATIALGLCILAIKFFFDVRRIRTRRKSEL